MSRASTQQMLGKLPATWAIGLLVLLVVYWFVQPTLNDRLGLSLPSLASLIGEPENQAAQKKSSSEKAKDPPTTPANKPVDPGEPLESEASGKTKTPSKSSKSNHTQPAETGSGTRSADAGPTEQRTKSEKPTTSPKATPREDLLYGRLKEVGRDRYVSIEGLQYNPGSEEGHRLKHLERHLKDQPDRPGKHGVFDGDMAQALEWIDEAYARGKRRAQGVRERQEDDRTIYEVPFSQPVGYIGGRDGKRDGHPVAKRIRLVVEGNRFITAFPF